LLFQGCSSSPMGAARCPVAEQEEYQPATAAKDSFHRVPAFKGLPGVGKGFPVTR